MIDYKNTLNLPSTKFPMKGNLINTEPKILEYWNKEDLYNKVRQIKKGKKKFILHDGPPYANGNIHIGHLINKTLKDIIIKSQGFMDYDAPYIPGWDCHGLPIELQVEKLLKKYKKKISNSKFRHICRLYVIKQINKQKKDFMRMGVLGDWNKPYFTMDFNVEANIIRILGKMVSLNYIYQGIKPVHWCINCCSALADTEIEYHKLISTSIDVIFTTVNYKKLSLIFNLKKDLIDISIVIWTTTPWTLPANKAIALNPDFIYTLIEIKSKGYIVANTLIDNFIKRIGINNYEILGQIKGYLLEFIRFKHPFMEYDVPIVLGKYITSNTGTGCVHIAPAYGIDDYIISKQYNLEIIDLINNQGYYISDILKSLDGLFIYEANNIIIKILRDNNNLLQIEKIHHNHPYCWRHKTPTIFKTTLQWFLDINKNKLRERLLKTVDDICWIPNWGKKRMKNMILERPDWCISRQRIWGIPITLFVHKTKNTIHPNSVILIEKIATLVEKHGIQAWWDLNPKDIIGQDIESYNKVEDTLDVWFDSGSTCFTIIPFRSEISNFQSDIYLEGHDQYRGWFMSSLIISVAIKHKPSYKKVLTHGFIVDNNGYKMSKSLNNVISLQEIIDKFGVDILRLWIASTNYTNEITISYKTLDHFSDLYRRIRNTIRFLLANLNNFNPEYHIINTVNMIEIDKWIINHTKITQEKIVNYYKKYEFNNVVQHIIKFCSIEMNTFYLDIIKDRQYTSKKDSIAQRSCQTAMYYVIESLVRWIAPITSFTAHEVWQFIPGKRSQFIFTEVWYNNLSKLNLTFMLNDSFWTILFKIKNKVNKVIEDARTNKIIGNSLEAKIILYVEPYIAKQLKKIGEELRFALLISQIKIININTINSNKVENLKVELMHADGKKCARCWHYEINVGDNINYPNICLRCIDNIYGYGEIRKFI